MLLRIIGLVVVGASAPVCAKGQSLAQDPRVGSALGLLEVWAEAQQAYRDIPGMSMAVVYDQDVLWSRGFGYANREHRTPATPRTIYSICSISKLFTSIAVLQLRDAGALRLDDSVTQHLPWFNIRRAYRDAPPITIRALLTHSSGLPRESDFPYWTAEGYPFPTREQVMERVSEQETLYPADRYYQYSNLGLTLAGEIVAEESGVPYAQYVRRHVLEPLELEDTSPEIPAALEGRRLATGYGARTREGGRHELALFQARGIAPAAGFASTVVDLAKFASWQFRLLAHGGAEILGANTLREMQRVHWLDPDWKTTRGLGFSVWRSRDETFVGHGGSCPGFRSHLLIQPNELIATVFMSNAIDVRSRDFTQAAYRIVAPAISEALETPDEGRRADPALERYAGAYENVWGGEIAVLPWQGQLAMVYLPTETPLDELIRLEPAGPQTFRRIREDETLGEEIRFDTNEGGEVVRLVRHSNRYPKVR